MVQSSDGVVTCDVFVWKYFKDTLVKQGPAFAACTLLYAALHVLIAYSTR